MSTPSIVTFMSFAQTTVGLKPENVTGTCDILYGLHEL